MFKIKNKFIIFIILIILWIILTLIIRSYIDKNKNLDSFVILINWEAKLNDNVLIIKEKSKLSVWDVVQTIWNNSLAVLEWWDGSVTRLWWNTSAKIWELQVSHDLSKINIKFNLLSGKTWSNVVSFFWEGSYFKEYFRDSEAAVRWTVFNVDLDKQYLYVINHKVDLTTSNGDLITVNEQEPFDLKNFTFISLDNFIKSFKDKSFEEINIQFDNELLLILKKRLISDIANINKLNEIDLNGVLWNEVKKSELYDKMLTDYQKLNFIKPDEQELFKIKLELKDKLLQLSTPENKNILINSTLNDFKEMIESKQYENIDLLLTILSDNKDILINFNLNDYLKNSVVPEEIKAKVTDKFWELKDFFSTKFDTIKNIQEKADWLIHQWLDTLFDK